MPTGERRDQIRGRELRVTDVQAVLASGIIIPSYFNSSVFGLVGDITTIEPTDNASAGVLTRLARADHQHDINTAAAVSVGMTNTEGSAATFARSDHGHGINVPAVRAVWSANTSCADNSSTAIAWGGTDEYDTDTMHNPVTNNTRITFSTAGVYKFGGWWKMAADVDGARGISVRKNGTTSLVEDNKVTAVFGTAADDTMAISGEAKFAAADYIELMAAIVGAGAALNVTAGAFWASYRTAG